MIHLPPHITTVALIANGALGDPAIAQEIRKFSYVVAVDGGLAHCHAMGIAPDLLVGDLDSVSESLLALYPDVPVHRLPRMKDETDLEVAIQLIDKPQVMQIVIFCGLQNRTDHLLANLQLLRRYPERLQIWSVSERIFAVRGEVELVTQPGQVISFMSLGGEVRGVSSLGLQWELNSAVFDADFFSLSNRAVGKCVKLSISTGDLVCFFEQ